MTDLELQAGAWPSPEEITAAGMTLTLLPGQLLVDFTDTASAAEISTVLREHRLRAVAGAGGTAPGPQARETPPRLQRLELSEGADMVRVMAELRAHARVRTASPLYHRVDRLPADTATSFTDKLLVHFEPGASEQEIDALVAAAETETVSIESFVRDGASYQLRLPRPVEMFAVVEHFARSPLVRYAGPDWIQLRSPSSISTPNDPKFVDQWNLRIIEAPRGWDHTLGSRRVVIAIIDSGCDVTHPDLIGKVVSAADHFDVLAGTGTPNPTWEHGTLCAGIAAAQTDNEIGVAGVAPNCMIMPIRLYDGRPGTANGILSQQYIVSAIGWARTHGADVINMSWHYDDGPHNLVDIALSDAYAANIVLVAASGNCELVDKCTDRDAINYPASHRAVMAVGASDSKDRRQTLDSPGTPRWRSIYGEQLSVMAPGTGCPTTQLGGDYAFFRGTSAAAPHVAGLAALIMSFHPRRAGHVLLDSPFVPSNRPRNGLTNDQVSRIIEESAERVGGYAYGRDPAHPHGRWNREMGYGRINVANALLRAREYLLGGVSPDFSLVVQVLFGLVGGGPGVVLPPGGPPVPVDPGWRSLPPEKRDVLLGLAVTELAEGIDDEAAREALAQAGWNAVAQTAQRMSRVT